MAIGVVALSYFMEGYIEDLVLGEIPESMPYLTGFGVVGGMSTFDNPLQGAILAPMLLVVMSSLYKLHLEMTQEDTESKEKTNKGQESNSTKI